MTLFYDEERREALDGAEAVDLFGGPGGWDEALDELGVPAVGLEFDRWACSTRRAAGHRTVECDISHVDPADYLGAVGLIASPPCQAFSLAGGRAGLDHVAGLVTAIRARDWGYRPSRDARVWLALEVGRWYEALNPEWVALEQVPAVLPLWEAYAEVLRADGFSVWVGVLNAADYGVPQTRRRAVLIASRTREVGCPPVTHDRAGGDLIPWVSMADALGLDEKFRVGFPRRDDGRDPDNVPEDGMRERDWREAGEPSFVVTEKARSWVIDTGNNSELGGGRTINYERSIDEPSPTIRSQTRSWVLNTGRDWQPGGTREDAQEIPFTEPAPTLTTLAGRQWQLRAGRNHNATVRDVDEPAPTLAFGKAYDDWMFTRPATTIQGDSRVWPPGHKINADDIERLGADEAAERYGDRAGTDAVRLTIEQALVLQSFRPDYPVRGVKSKQFEQVGNACPPRLASHIIRQVTGK